MKMVNIDSARKYRAARYEAREKADKISGLPQRIANQLAGLAFNDMTKTERQIADLLGREGYLFFDEHGDCKEL